MLVHNDGSHSFGSKIDFVGPSIVQVQYSRQPNVVGSGFLLSVRLLFYQNNSTSHDIAILIALPDGHVICN